MFSLERILRFGVKALKVFLPFVLLAIIPAFLAEMFPHLNELPQTLRTGRFWILVGLNILPVIAAALIPFWLAGRFIAAVYSLGGWRGGLLFLLRSRFGNWSFGPWARIEEGKIAQNPDNELAHVGGPGGLIVGIDSAVVLEKGGKFTRVEGPGFPRLESFEKIYDIIDLRPKSYRYDVSAMTKEGIPINWEAEVRYQVADGGKSPEQIQREEIKKPPKPGENMPPLPIYSVAKEEIFRASTCKWRREDSWGHGQDMDWEGLVVVSRTEGILRSILARRSLDQLIGLGKEDERAAREAVQKELEDKLRQAVPVLGAKILEVKLHQLKVDDDVTQQWIKVWKARWQRWSAGQLAQGEASRIYLYETTKADSQMRLIASIARGLEAQVASQAVSPEAVNQLILMRLFSVLDRAHFDASSRVFFPTQALDMLNRMRRLIRDDESQAALPPGSSQPSAHSMQSGDRKEMMK